MLTIKVKKAGERNRSSISPFKIVRHVRETKSKSDITSLKSKFKLS